MLGVCHNCFYRGRGPRCFSKDLISMTARTTIASTTEPRSKLSRVSATLGRAWTEARVADRRLMEMRTSLSRHSG
jgi:hypothetical protein